MDRLNLDKFKVIAAATTLAMFAGVASAESHLNLYGNINRLLTTADDGYHAVTLFSDNGFAPSVLGVKGDVDINRCVEVGGVLEAQYSADNSMVVSQLDQSENATKILTARRADVYVDFGKFGKLSLGHNDAATLGVMSLSYSKAGDTISRSAVRSLAGGMLFSRIGAGTPPPVTNPTVGLAFSDLDGVNASDNMGTFRQVSRVRYDSPKWCGLWVSASGGKLPRYTTTTPGSTYETLAANTKQYGDVAVRFERCFDDFSVAAAVGYAYFNRAGFIWDDRNTALVDVNTSHNEQLFAGSIAVEHKCTGINAALGYGNKRFRVGTPRQSNNENWFAQVGKHFCFTDVGKTHLVGDYFHGKHTLGNTDKSESWQVGIVQDLDKAHASAYATYRNYKYDPNSFNTAARYSDVKVFAVGMMYKFGAML